MKNVGTCFLLMQIFFPSACSIGNGHKMAVLTCKIMFTAYVACHLLQNGGWSISIFKPFKDVKNMFHYVEFHILQVI